MHVLKLYCGEFDDYTNDVSLLGTLVFVLLNDIKIALCSISGQIIHKRTCFKRDVNSQ